MVLRSVKKLKIAVESYKTYKEDKSEEAIKLSANLFVRNLRFPTERSAAKTSS